MPTPFTMPSMTGQFASSYAGSSTYGGGSATGIAGGILSLVGAGVKYYGGYLGAENQYRAAQAEADLMRSEAFLMDYNADLARQEEIIAERERDIEIDQHRDVVSRILGKQATFYAWGNIDIGDPRGTPAQVRLRSLYAAEYDEGIIIERGWIKKEQARGKAAMYKFRASQIRGGAVGVEEGGRMARTAGLLSLTGELLKDTGALKGNA